MSDDFFAKYRNLATNKFVAASIYNEQGVVQASPSGMDNSFVSGDDDIVSDQSDCDNNITLYQVPQDNLVDNHTLGELFDS